MKTVSIDALDEKTGQWLREAGQHEGFMVTDHGKPIVTIQPVQLKSRLRTRFSTRVVLPEYQALTGHLGGGTDATEIISKDRDRAA